MKSKFLCLVFLLALLSLTTSALAEGNGNETLVNETPTNDTPLNDTLIDDTPIDENITYDINTTNVTVTINPVIIEALENKTEVLVTVMLKDDSNIPYGDTRQTISERRLIYEQKAAYFSQAEDEVISTLVESEFRLESKSALINAFRGYITKAGLEKLRLNPKVVSIEGQGFIAPGIGEGQEIIGKENSTDKLVISLCGNKICEVEETCENCASDCSCGDSEDCVKGECKALKDDEPGPEPVEPELSWFGRLIQFLKSLLGL